MRSKSLIWHLRFESIVLCTLTGATDLEFSRGGGFRKKNFKKFVDSFFKVDQINFLISHQWLIKSLFDQIFCCAGKS